MNPVENVLGKEKIKKICLVSSAAFSAASGAYPWTAIISAGLGLCANIDPKNRPELEEEFIAAVDAALSKTKNELTTADSKKIIDELSSDVVRPDNIGALIINTETYRRQYCTESDKKRIVDLFDMYFKEEVCRYGTLSNYYLLAAGTVTLDAIKRANDALVDQDKKLSAIQQGVNGIDNKTNRIFVFFKNIFVELGFVLVATAGCLLAAVVQSIHVPLFYIHVIFSYSVASFFTFIILDTIRDKYSAPRITNSEKPHLIVLIEKIRSLFTLLFIYATLSVGVYLIIVASQSLEMNNMIVKQLSSVAVGSLLCCSIKNLYQPWSYRLQETQEK